MPPNSNSADEDNGLPPPGQRWGSGVESVLPYLTKSLQAKPAGHADPREQKPADASRRAGASEHPSRY